MCFINLNLHQFQPLNENNTILKKEINILSPIENVYICIKKRKCNISLTVL